MQYRLPAMQNQAGFQNMIPSVNQGNTLRGVAPDLPPNVGPRNYRIPHASYVGSGYPAMPGLQYPMAFPRGLTSPRPLGGSSGSMSPTNSSGNLSVSAGVVSSSGGQIEG